MWTLTCITPVQKQPGMTQRSGFALNVEASLKLPATVYFSTLLTVCSLALSSCLKPAWMTSKIQSHPPSPFLFPSSLSPDSVWHSVGLVAVALAVAGVLRAAGGSLVPPQCHRPVGEHRDTFGNAPAGLRREQCETETVGHFQKKVFFRHCWCPGNIQDRQGSSLLEWVHTQWQWKRNKAKS